MSNSFKGDFIKSMDNIRFSSSEKSKMIDSLEQAFQSESEREELDMKSIKKWTLSRVAAVVVVCFMATGVTAFAASKIVSITASSHSSYDYKSASDMTLDEGENEMFIFPDSIGNGYMFDGGNKIYVGGKDDSGNTVDKWDDLRAVYRNENGTTISISTSYHPSDDGDRTATETRVINGVTVNYNLDEYLVLPANAENQDLDADIKDRLDIDDHFFVSYGSDEPETYYFSGVLFEKAGVTFNIFTNDEVTADELFDIAEELISE